MKPNILIFVLALSLLTSLITSRSSLAGTPASAQTINCKSLPSRVVKIIAEHLGVKEQTVVPSARLSKELNADLLDLVELQMAFEEEFKLSISDEKWDKIKTVQQAINYVRKTSQCEK